MKRRIILILGILVAIIAIWLSLRNGELTQDISKLNHLFDKGKELVYSAF
jgi:hypothetical protein